MKLGPNGLVYQDYLLTRNLEMNPTVTILPVDVYNITPPKNIEIIRFTPFPSLSHTNNYTITLLTHG